MTEVFPEERAQELLPTVLNQEERARFHRTGEIVITGSMGGRYTILRHSVTGNVIPKQGVNLASGFARAGAKICAHPPMSWWNGKYLKQLPLTDGLISQILAIKADEEKFLRTAYFYSY